MADYVMRSTDGGATWTAVAMPAGTRWLDIRFSSATEGIAAGPFGTIRTHDAGLTWARDVGSRPSTLTALAVRPDGVSFAIDDVTIYRYER
jgi:photosystem II stability/assembly factor-like uncharacterized protein